MTLSLHWPCRTALLGAVLGCAALPAFSATLSVSVMGQNGRGVQDAVLLLEPLAGKAPVSRPRAPRSASRTRALCRR